MATTYNPASEASKPVERLITRSSEARSPRADHAMYFKTALKQVLWSFALALAMVFARPTFGADELDFRKSVGNFWVYLSVMPAQFVSGPPVSDGATPVEGSHHVMVSVFDYRTGRRITDAKVEARVAALGFSGTKKKLEATTVAGALVYAGLFAMQGRGPFRVDVEFRVEVAARPQHATFYFSHPSFTAPKSKELGGSNDMADLASMSR